MISRRDAFSLFVWVTYISSFSFVLATRSTRRLKSDRQTLKKNNNQTPLAGFANHSPQRARLTFASLASARCPLAPRS